MIKRKSFSLNCPLIWAVCVGLATLLVYFLMIAPSVAPQADSGELVTAAYTLGIPHPPGYPLYTFVAHFFTLLPWGSVAWRVNLFSALTQAAAVSVLFLLIFQLTKNRLTALAGSLILAFSYTFWLYGLVAEVFALNDLFALLIIYFALRRQWVWAALFFGFGFFHHLTIILLVPALLYWWWQQRKWQWKFVPAALVGLIPYLYVVVVAKTRVGPLMWSFPDNLDSLARLMFRADYGSFSPTVGQDPALALLSDKVAQVTTYFRFLVDDFLWLGIFLGALGVIWLLLRQRRLAIFLLLGFITSGIFFLSYANFPLYDYSIMGLAVTERFYLLPNIFWAVFIAFGLKLLRPPLLVIIAGWYVVLLIINHYPLVNQSGNFLALNLGANLLRSAPKNAVIFLQGDTLTFATFYARYVDHFRPDVELIMPNMIGPDNRFRYLKSVRPQLDISLPKTASIAGFLEANLDRVPIAYAGVTGFPGGELSAGSPSGLPAHLTLADQALLFYGYGYGAPNPAVSPSPAPKTSLKDF
ncbi:MAG: DUF2723 domain-containing protein [Patescibacteria group bacterium]|nr:DUF2723 domain-containing protein [Patescibacteria group bacterium]MCL5432088.1 DUF2723 domain-containing protein [Patescibacteria group bacterium]